MAGGGPAHGPDAALGDRGRAPARLWRHGVPRHGRGRHRPRALRLGVRGVGARLGHRRRGDHSAGHVGELHVGDELVEREPADDRPRPSCRGEGAELRHRRRAPGRRVQRPAPTHRPERRARHRPPAGNPRGAEAAAPRGGRRRPDHRGEHARRDVGRRPHGPCRRRGALVGTGGRAHLAAVRVLVPRHGPDGRPVRHDQLHRQLPRPRRRGRRHRLLVVDRPDPAAAGADREEPPRADVHGLARADHLG